MSKLYVMIKNYLKLIFRNKVMIIVVPIATILVVAALANAFHTLLDYAEDISGIKMGYELPADSKYAFVEQMMVKSLAEQDITAVAYETGDPEQLLNAGDVDVFVAFEKDGYHIYGDDKKMMQCRMIQYVFFQVDKNMAAAINGEVPDIKTASLETVKTSEAENYYGIIEIVYFLSMSAVSELYISNRASKSYRNQIFRR